MSPTCRQHVTKLCPCLQYCRRQVYVNSTQRNSDTQSHVFVCRIVVQHDSCILPVQYAATNPRAPAPRGRRSHRINDNIESRTAAALTEEEGERDAVVPGRGGCHRGGSVATAASHDHQYGVILTLGLQRWECAVQWKRVERHSGPLG